ncbi:hypothetical protein L218DRAFT_133992 [Marasmius fiardii PR-910]|nr:hypothetical protein L218DRAFT_133992 [Marasmius fiardii PR-910]
MFNNSSSHYIRNATFNVVYGNQYNYTHYYQNDDPPEEEWKLKLKREYDRIPAGKIKIIKTISETGIWRHEYEDGLIDQKERLDSSRAKRVVHIACLDMERAESSPLLCVSYTGRDAHKREFIALSRIRHSSVIQLRGFNDSDIPMILFQQAYPATASRILATFEVLFFVTS